MKKLVIALVLLSACTGWQMSARDTLSHIHQSAVKVRETVAPMLIAWCEAERDACIKKLDNDCPRLRACDDTMMAFAIALAGVHQLVIDADMAIAVGDQDSADAAVAKALELLNEIYVQLKAMGLL